MQVAITHQFILVTHTDARKRRWEEGEGRFRARPHLLTHPSLFSPPSLLPSLLLLFLFIFFLYCYLLGLVHNRRWSTLQTFLHVMYRVSFTLDSRVIHFPPASRENMLVALIPTSLADFTGMALIFLDRCIGSQSDVIMNVKVE